MVSELSYKIIKAVGGESSKGNDAFEKLEQIVNEHIREGWQPVGGVSISAVVGAPRPLDRQKITGSCVSRRLWCAKLRNNN